jgi:hypothetical protein
VLHMKHIKFKLDSNLTFDMGFVANFLNELTGRKNVKRDILQNEKRFTDLQL